jgi:hypothetical protein
MPGERDVKRVKTITGAHWGILACIKASDVALAKWLLIRWADKIASENFN